MKLVGLANNHENRLNIQRNLVAQGIDRDLSNRKCYFKEIAPSTSPEGEQMKKQYPNIPFTKCERSCHGYDDRCAFYRVRMREE